MQRGRGSRHMASMLQSAGNPPGHVTITLATEWVVTPITITGRYPS